MRSRTSLLFLFFQVFLLSICLGQQKTITLTGHVQSEDGKPLAGASIQANGTRAGTTTNDRGDFTLHAPESVKSITISAIGYSNQVIPIAGQTSFSISLKPGDQSLNQV